MEFKAFTTLAYQFAFEHAKTLPENARFVVSYSNFAHSIGLPDNVVNALGLATIFEEARDKHFLSLVHQHQVALFEHLFFDMLRLLLTDQPLRLPGKRQIEYSVIVAANTKDEIISNLIERELNEIKYKSVGDWFTYLERLVSKCTVSDADLGSITEAKATRDLFVHNAGVANKIYLQKAGQFARFKVGEKVSVDGDYTLDVWQLLSSVLITAIDCLIHEFDTKATAT
ncbi:MAG: hypothetical protein KJ889_04035 [Gammaproteobacteria bacterium]|nr:hypothetical protein [Gammaproteobacteria bacterium]